MMTKQTKIIGVTSLLVTVGAFVLFAAGLYTVERTESKLAEKQQEVAESRFRTEEMVSLVRLVDTSASEREELAHYVLHNEDVIDFLTLVEAVGAEQGVLLEIPKLDEKPIDDTFDELQLTIALEGSYERIMNTVRIFETVPYQASVASVSMTKDVSQNWRATIEMHITKHKAL